MHGSRDSSVWRTLAVAFGDGLAFGVGLTLTNNAARAATKKPSEPTPDIKVIEDRLNEIEQRIERPRIAGSLPTVTANGATVAKVAEAVVTAMDGRFVEIGEEVERRLAELEERLKAELEALEARESGRAEGRATGAEGRVEALRGELTAAIEAQRLRADSDARVARSQMLEVHKQFAETLARLVDEQIEHTVALRLQAVQEQTREAAREESALAMANFGRSMEALIETRMEALRQEQSARERESARRVDEQIEHTVAQRLQAVREESALTMANFAKSTEAMMDARLETLRQERSEGEREIARRVGEQIEHTVALRLQAAQEQTREGVREESAVAMANFGKNVEGLIDTRLEALRKERSESEREIAALRARLEGNEHNMFEVVLALGKSCMDAAQQMTPANSAPANGNGGGGGETHITATEICDLPSFARAEAPRHLWRVPFVSCFLMATTGLLALHFLVV